MHMTPVLRNGGDGVSWGAHLCEHLVQPLQRPVKMYFNPARGGSDVLPMVFSPPSLDETHTYRAMFGELIDSFVSVIDALRKQLSKLLVVEDF